MDPARPGARTGTLTTTVLAAALGLAAAMGVGRFVFTPILPVMAAQAGMSEQQGALVATANYIGYLLGALALTGRNAASSRLVVIVTASALVVSEALMLASTSILLWSVLRFAAGFASAVLFIACAARIQALRGHPRVSPDRADRARGLGFAGVGLGIALTGAGTLAAGPHAGWQMLWAASAALSAVLLLPLAMLPSLRSRPSPPRGMQSRTATSSQLPAHRRRVAWTVLMLLYFAEGLGYIVIGTFLVDAVTSDSMAGTGDGQVEGWATGSIVWLAVGLAGIAAPLLWSTLARPLGLRGALLMALSMQTAGAFIPALTASPSWAVLAALLFGGTFVPITMLALSVGAQLRVPHSAAKLTAAYGLGQVLGPVLVIPVLGEGYTTAFAVAGGILVAATGATIALATLMRPRAR